MESQITRSREKIRDLTDLGERVAGLRAEGKCIVQCHGCFDLIHPGHIRHLEAAKQEGDVLVVTVTPDRHVDKGPGRPVFNEQLRAESLAALHCVDLVAINRWPTAVETIELLRPHVFVKGSDYSRRHDLTGNLHREEEAVKSVGGRLHITDVAVLSSTKLLNSYFEVLPAATESYLRDLRARYTAADVIDALESLAQLDVVVIGDAVIEERHVCRPQIGDRRHPSVVARHVEQEVHARGALAVANCLAGFCGSVRLVTAVGSDRSRESFLRQHLSPAVAVTFARSSGTPVVVRKRFVDESTGAQLFEVEHAGERCASESDRAVSAALSTALPTGGGNGVHAADAVLAVDLGHGTIGPSTIQQLSGAPFLAVLSVMSSASYGFPSLLKYPRVDYRCLTEAEARLAAGDPEAPIEMALEKLARQQACRLVAATLDDGGSVSVGPDGTEQAPLLTATGARSEDAETTYFAMTAACARAGYSADLIPFLGVVATTLASRIPAGRSVEPLDVSRFVTALLKR